LENGLILRQFEEIEQRIDELMETLGSLEAANAELKARILQLEEALQEKTAAENRYSEEKTEIKSRIDGLLRKLEAATEH
jgi:chromosome segregation ATPase